MDVMTNPDMPSTDNVMMGESLTLEIDRVLSSLKEREELVIRMSFGIGEREMTLDEIGDKLGLTRERVRQIKEKAIKQLRESGMSKQLKAYLG